MQNDSHLHYTVKRSVNSKLHLILEIRLKEIWMLGLFRSQRCNTSKKHTEKIEIVTICNPRCNSDQNKNLLRF